ncbi:LCP family protein [Microtetraspora malaysiensis]|uniref:LCP family protein n=1 Tax=Microtetraspora malaysiensis TaxID=161358 RepID=UPI000A58AA05|nr:LCP family protein [Microtetraspora malaysiensis]
MDKHNATLENGPDGPSRAGKPTRVDRGDRPGGARAGAGRRRVHRPAGRRVSSRRILRWSAALAAAVLLPTVGAAYLGYTQLSGNITHEKVTDRLGTVRPPKYTKALNILLIGSDTRAGENAQFGHTAGARSDTIILLHISPRRDGATAISFPRDLMVDAPACTTATGAAVPPTLEMINATFSAGGAACTWKTIESVTGIRIDHFMQIDFTGFKRMVDALGGVEVCLPEAVNDPKSHLELAAGRHTVTGNTALAYVRTRYALGDGSDLGRIRRQQLFMAAMVRKATSTGLITSPVRLYKFLNAATKSLTTDDDLDLGTLRTIADSVRGMSTGQVRFLTVPNHYWEVDPNRVALTQPQAAQLFTAVSKDTRAPAANPSNSASPGSTTPTRATVSVRVVNGSGRAGLARRVTARLRNLGFTRAVVATAPTSASRTAIRTTMAGQAATRVLAGALTRSPALTREVGTGRTLTLVLGDDWAAAPGRRGIRLRDAASGGIIRASTLSSGVTARTGACHA